MISRANNTLIGGLPDWQARVLVLLLFAGFMTLAARVLYLQGSDVSANRGTNIDRNGGPLAIIAATVSKMSSTRVPAVARARVVPPPPALFNA